MTSTMLSKAGVAVVAPFIETDGGQPNGGNNQMVVADSSTARHHPQGRRHGRLVTEPQARQTDSIPLVGTVSAVDNSGPRDPIQRPVPLAGRTRTPLIRPSWIPRLHFCGVWPTRRPGAGPAA